MADLPPPFRLGATDRSFEDVRDRQAIHELVTAFVSFNDLHEFDRFAACYADEITVDNTETLGGPVRTLPKGPVIEFWKCMTLAMDGLSHSITNVAIALEGDTASTRSYCRAVHWMGERVFTSGGLYLHKVKKQPDGRWLITYQKFVPRWSEGDRSVLAVWATNTAKNPFI